tara:strand:- start:528 stop:806 length:279 start_codon:yes stop_codon:yes gene_type:complete
MINFNIFLGYLNKVIFGFWGLTIVDMMFLIDLDYLPFMDEHIKQIFALLGLIYFTIQIPFKIINLNHKRKMDAVDLQNKINLQVNLQKKNKE